MTSTRMKRLGAAVTTVALAASLFASSSAHADPKQLSAFVGVGSDTTQDVTNAFAGFSGGTNYVPLQSSVASGQKQLISFDALPPAGATDTCITTKTGAASFARPNGSTSGRRALSRSIDHAGYGSAACGGFIDVSGLVTFARSSAGPASGDTGTALTYVPFGRDGITFAYYKPSAGAAITALTRTQLTSLFATGATTIGGVRILPCGIQLGSGTYNFWLSAVNVTAGQEATATTECNNLLGAGVRAEENSGVDLKARGDAAETAVPGTEVIIGFSAANFIAKSNGVSSGVIPAGVQMGAISDNGSGTNLGSPVAGSAPNLTPVATFYNDGTFGRRVYNVFPSSVLAGLPGVNADIKSMFTTPSATICSAPALVTLQKFGFLPASDCGVTTIKGSLIDGQL
jgi:ABC-type phosphate transport system substrate-binding protein